MAYKVFAAGNVLTAVDVDNYLMNQTVIVVTSGSRPSPPVVGMTIYETDTGNYVFYDGTVWRTLLSKTPTLDTTFSVDGMGGAYTVKARIGRVGPNTLAVRGQVLFTGASTALVLAYSFLAGGVTILSQDSVDYPVGSCWFSALAAPGLVVVDAATSKLKFMVGGWNSYLGVGTAVSNGNALIFTATVPIT